MKKIILLALVLTMIVSFAAGCAPATEETATPAAPTDPSPADPAPEDNDEERQLVIGFSQSVMNHPFRIAMVDTFHQAALAYGDRIRTIVTEGDGDVHSEITNIEALIAQGADAIIVSSLSGTAIYPAYRLVHEAGIPLIIAASGAPEEHEDAFEYMSTFVSTDEVLMGIAAAEYADYLLGGGEGRVVMIRGVIESTNSMLRYIGWNQRVVDFPGIDVIAVQPANWLRLEAIQVMTDLLVAHSDIDIVYAENDEMALGALQAIRDAGREDEIMIISMDGQEDAAQEIQRGSAFMLTITNNPDTTEALAAAYRLARGESVPKRILLDYEMVTRENVDDYIARTFG